MRFSRTFAAIVLAIALGSGGLAPGQDRPAGDVPPPPRPEDLRRAIPNLGPHVQEQMRQDDEAVAGILAPAILPALDPAREAGLTEGTTPRRLSARDAYRLALIRARTPEAFEGDRLGVLGQLDEEGDGDHFARFRAEFVEGPGRAAFRDPGPAYFETLGALGQIERARIRLATHEQLSKILTLYARGGASSGVSRMDLDRANLALQVARRQFESTQGRYRDALDRLRARLGLPPDAPVVPDPAAIAPLLGFFREFDRLIADPSLDEARFFPVFGRAPGLVDLTIGDVALSRFDDAGGSPEPALRAAEARRREAGGDPGPAGDAEALRVRRLVRDLIELRRDSTSARDRMILAARGLDETLRDLAAPPRADRPEAVGMADLTRLNLDARGEVLRIQCELIQTWADYHAKRLELAAALGLAPGDSWEGYLGLPAAAGGEGR